MNKEKNHRNIYILSPSVLWKDPNVSGILKKATIFKVVLKYCSSHELQDIDKIFSAYD